MWICFREGEYAFTNCASLYCCLFVSLVFFFFPLTGDDGGEERSEGILDSRGKNLYDFFPAKWKAQSFSAFENEP